MAERFYKHPSAVIDAGAVIGDRTKIWHFSHICEGAQVGADCVLGQNSYVASAVRVGDNVKIQNNVSIYDAVIIESHAFIGPSVVFTNVRNPRSEVPRKHEYQATYVRVGATLGANATVVCGHEVGPYAFIGAGSVVTANIPPFALCFGVPARQVGWMCRCGARLNVEHGAGYCLCGRGYRVEGQGLCEA